MNTYEFLMLSRKEQHKLIAEQSQFIMRKDSGLSYFKLYAIGLFFVEVEKEIHTHEILDIGIFVCGTKLDKYAGELIL